MSVEGRNSKFNVSLIWVGCLVSQANDVRCHGIWFIRNTGSKRMRILLEVGKNYDMFLGL
jgi:hypothetical protein